MSNRPVDLRKPDDNFSPLMNKLDDWALKHAHIILPLAFIMLLFLFVAVCFALVGVSATDSGVQYNHFQDVI